MVRQKHRISHKLSEERPRTANRTILQCALLLYIQVHGGLFRLPGGRLRPGEEGGLLLGVAYHMQLDRMSLDFLLGSLPEGVHWLFSNTFRLH